MSHILTPTANSSIRKIIQRTRQKWRFMTALCCISLLQFQSVAYAEYGIQVGAFVNKDNAARLAERMNNQGFTVTMVPVIDSALELTRVIVGPYPTTASAVAARKRLAGQNTPGILIDYPVGATQTSQSPADDVAGAEEVLTAETPGLENSGAPEVLIMEEPIDDTATGSPGLTIDDTSEILLVKDKLGGSLPDDETLRVLVGAVKEFPPISMVRLTPLTPPEAYLNA